MTYTETSDVKQKGWLCRSNGIMIQEATDILVLELCLPTITRYRDVVMYECPSVYIIANSRNSVSCSGSCGITAGN